MLDLYTSHCFSFNQRHHAKDCSASKIIIDKVPGLTFCWLDPISKSRGSCGIQSNLLKAIQITFQLSCNIPFLRIKLTERDENENRIKKKKNPLYPQSRTQPIFWNTVSCATETAAVDSPVLHFVLLPAVLASLGTSQEPAPLLYTPPSKCQHGRTLDGQGAANWAPAPVPACVAFPCRHLSASSSPSHTCREGQCNHSQPHSCNNPVTVEDT